MKRKRDEPPPLQLEASKQQRLDPAAALSALAAAGMPAGPGAGLALGMTPLGLLGPPPPLPGAAPPVLTPEHQTLVHKIKQAQKSSQSWKDKWAEYIEQKSGSKLRDPARHDVAFLKQAIADIGDPDAAIAEGDVGTGHLAASEAEWDEFYNRLDERARRSLDDLPRVVRDMIKRRIMQGGLGGIRNASAVLMGKIRAAEDAAGGSANLQAQAEKVARELENKMV